MKVGKAKTVQVGERLIIADGINPLRHLDLSTNKVHTYKPPKVGLKRRILRLFGRQPVEDVMFYPKKDGFKTIGQHQNVMNILTTTEPRLRFDGQIRWYEK